MNLSQRISLVTIILSLTTAIERRMAGNPNTLFAEICFSLGILGFLFARTHPEDFS